MLLLLVDVSLKSNAAKHILYKCIVPFESSSFFFLQIHSGFSLIMTETVKARCQELWGGQVANVDSNAPRIGSGSLQQGDNAVARWITL